MAHLLRGKQAGIHNDLSAGLGPDLFVLDHVGACATAPRGAALQVCVCKLTRQDSQLWHKLQNHANRI
jgi:hypothetical protein